MLFSSTALLCSGPQQPSSLFLTSLRYRLQKRVCILIINWRYEHNATSRLSILGCLSSACSLSSVSQSCHPAVIQVTKTILRILLRLAYGMNPSANTNEQQGDPSWVTENWDNPGAVGSLDQASRQYTANRLEWEWDPMILAQHPGSGGSNEGSDGDRKNQITAGTKARCMQIPLPAGVSNPPVCCLLYSVSLSSDF